MGRRGRHHAARRSRRRRDRRDDGRRLSGRDSPDHRRVFRRPPRRCLRRVRALAAADQLREPAVGLPHREGADEGRRRDRVRPAAFAVARAASAGTRGVARHGAAARSARAALGALATVFAPATRVRCASA
ncbi:hypothetical protein F01_420086 [Burkholderia cenocepacia]|nr:hypothetical protein F01_420086 [Burkholderia cenocepacia]